MKINTLFVVCILLICLFACSIRNNQTEYLEYKIEKEDTVPFKSDSIKLQKDSLFLGMWGFNNDIGEPELVRLLYIKDNNLYKINYWIRNLKIYDTSFIKHLREEIEIVKINDNYYWGNKPISSNLYNAISYNDSSFYIFSMEDEKVKRQWRGEKLNSINEIFDKYWAYINYCRKNDSTTIARWYGNLIFTRLFKDQDQYKFMYYSTDNTPQIANVKLRQIPGGYTLIDDPQREKTANNLSGFKNGDTSRLYTFIKEKRDMEDEGDIRLPYDRYNYTTIVDTFLFGQGFKWK